MARYRRRPRYFRRRTANYTVQRRLLQSNTWTQSRVDPQHWVGAIKLVENHMDSDLDPTSSGICTISHLACDIVKRPYFKFRTQWENHYNYDIPAVAWAIVYVPQGTTPNVPFSGTVQNDNMVFYEPNQFVLGAGVIPDAGNLFVNENVQAQEATFNTRPGAGNITRVRCPLSKKLNPGDSIWLVCSTTDMAFDFSTLVDLPAEQKIQLMVKYAVKYN